MAKYYCYFGEQVKGPISYEIIRNALWRGEITEDMMIRVENADEWTPLRYAIDGMRAEHEREKNEILTPRQNKFADNLLTTSFIVFICAALAQFIAGAILWSNGSLAVGLPLTLSSLGYIFPIAVSYVLRQMFRHQLRG